MSLEENRKHVRWYIDAVHSGRLKACRRIRQAVARHLKDLKKAKKKNAPFYFDEALASTAIDYFPLLKHTTGQYDGQPFVLRYFQKFIVWLLVGWRRRADATRRFHRAYLSMGRGGGKSPFAAALALFFTFLSGEARAEGYCCATKYDQAAKITHAECMRFVDRNAHLAELIEAHKHNLSTSDGSFLRPLGCDSKTSDGFITHVVVRDELHEWRKQHRGLHDKLDTSLAKRREPISISITTAGDEKSEIWLEEYDYCCRVLDGTEESESLLVIIYEIDADADIFDERVWPQSNPILLADGQVKKLDPDSPVKIGALRDMAARARHDVTVENKFRRYHGNQKTTSTERPIRLDVWNALRRPRSDLSGVESFGGFDLGRSNDFASWSLVFPSGPPDARRFELISRSYTCDQRHPSIDTEQVRRWVAEGKLISHSGDAVDFAAFQRDLVEAARRYRCKSLAYDPTFAQQMGQSLLNDHGLHVFEFHQTPKRYNEPIRTLLQLVAAGRISHDGDEVLAWQMANLQVKRDNHDRWMPDKQAGPFKIDAAVALLMGLSEALYGEQPATQDLQTIFG